MRLGLKSLDRPGGFATLSIEPCTAAAWPITVTASPSTTKLIALADLKAVLGVTDSASDALLGNIIQRGSDAMARCCNRVFAQRTVQETLPGPGGQLLKLKCSPVVTLTSIALDGDTVDSDTYTLTESDAGIVFCEIGQTPPDFVVNLYAIDIVSAIF